MKNIITLIIVAVISAVVGFIGGVVLAIKKPETITQIKNEIDKKTKKATEPEKSDNDNKDGTTVLHLH